MPSTEGFHLTSLLSLKSHLYEGLSYSAVIQKIGLSFSPSFLTSGNRVHFYIKVAVINLFTPTFHIILNF